MSTNEARLRGAREELTQLRIQLAAAQVKRRAARQALEDAEDAYMATRVEEDNLAERVSFLEAQMEAETS